MSDSSLLQQAFAADSSAAVAWRFNATNCARTQHKNEPVSTGFHPLGFSLETNGTRAKAKEEKPVETD